MSYKAQVLCHLHTKWFVVCNSTQSGSWFVQGTSLARATELTVEFFGFSLGFSLGTLRASSLADSERATELTVEFFGFSLGFSLGTLRASSLADSERATELTVEFCFPKKRNTLHKVVCTWRACYRADF
jgi:hypothetical protein